MFTDFLTAKGFKRFALLNLLFVVLPIVLFYRRPEAKVVFMPFVFFWSIYCLYLAYRNEIFESLLIFVYLTSMESLIRGYTYLPYSYLSYLSIILCFIVLFVKKAAPAPHLAHIIFIIYVFAAILSLAYTPDLYSGLWWILNYASRLVILLIFTTIAFDFIKVRLMALSFLLGATNFALISLYYYFVKDRLRLGMFYGTGANEIAYLLGVSCLICLIGFSLMNDKRVKIWLAGGAFLFGLIVLLSVTRGAIIGIIISYSMFLIKFGKTKYRSLVVFLAFFVFMVIIANPLSDGYLHRYLTNLFTVYGRVKSALISLNMLAQHPLFGFGVGSFKEASRVYYESLDAVYAEYNEPYVHTHNEFTQALAELGVIGFILLAGFMAEVLIKSSKNRLKSPFFVYLLFMGALEGFLLKYIDVVIALLLVDWCVLPQNHLIKNGQENCNNRKPVP